MIKKALVTCGPTLEPLDPVRFISNRSTGTLGIELARAFARRGYQVVLAAGPIVLPNDLGPRVRIVRFEAARELHRIALKEFSSCAAVCMTAAVADFRPALVAASKIKRGKTSRTIRLVPNPDILADLGRRKKRGQILVGFSVESEDLEARAEEKLARKNLDLIAAQWVGEKQNPFGQVEVNVTILGKGGSFERLRKVSKHRLAERLVSRVEALGRQAS